MLMLVSQGALSFTDSIKTILINELVLTDTSEISVLLKNTKNEELFLGVNITHWSLIIAIAAFLISFAVFLITKKHNQLSVKPLFLFRINTDKNIGKIKVFIMNKGLGPCIINEFEYYYGEKRMESMTDLFNEINKKFRPRLTIEFFNIHTLVYPLKNYALTPDEKKNLLFIDHKIPNEAKYRKYLEEVKKVVFKYKITDYYDNIIEDDFCFGRDFFEKRSVLTYPSNLQFLKKFFKEFIKNRKNRKNQSMN